MRRVLLGLAIAAAVAAGVAFVFRAPAEPPRPPRVELQPLPDDQRLDLKKWWDLQPQVPLPFATPSAKVVIVKFSDYQCPACRATYFGYEPVVEKYKDRPADVQFVLKHFPLDPKCNSAVHVRSHLATCDAAAAAVMASSRGTFDALTDWLFLHQDTLSPDTVREAAKRVGQIDDFDAEYEGALAKVKADAAAGATLKIESTPTFFVNGRMVVPAVSPAALDTLIQFEITRQP